MKQIITTAKSFVKQQFAHTRDRIEIAREQEQGVLIPQASIVEQNLEHYESRDWRTHFSQQLSGRGLEIGPLHRPMVSHEGMQVEYIDRCTVAELRAHYPELAELPLVEPDIIGDAETMQGIPDNEYDFLIAAHVIEHMKNPIASVQQWCRVIKPGGLLYVIVPDKRYTFDVKRVRTTIAHMIHDFQQPSEDRDFEHYLDYAIHVHNTSEEDAIDEAKRLVDTDYSIHFHVFMPSDALALLRWISKHVTPFTILEGPSKAPGSDEFHFLLQVAAPSA